MFCSLNFSPPAGHGEFQFRAPPVPSSFSDRLSRRFETVLSRTLQGYLLFKVLLEYTFNNVGQDSHCALPLVSSFWRKWDIVDNDLILIPLTLLVLIQDDSASECQTPRSFCFRQAAFHVPDNAIIAPDMGRLRCKHPHCKMKPPVTGRIDC